MHQNGARDLWSVRLQSTIEVGRRKHEENLPQCLLLEMMKNIRGWETETLIVVNGKELNLPPNRSVIKAAGVVKPV